LNSLILFHVESLAGGDRIQQDHAPGIVEKVSSKPCASEADQAERHEAFSGRVGAQNGIDLNIGSSGIDRICRACAGDWEPLPFFFDGNRGVNFLGCQGG